MCNRAAGNSKPVCILKTDRFDKKLRWGIIIKLNGKRVIEKAPAGHFLPKKANHW